MRIQLRLYASLASYMPREVEQNPLSLMEVKEGTAVQDLLKQLGVPVESVKIVFLNGIHAGVDEVLKEGDRLGVFPPVAGG